MPRLIRKFWCFQRNKTFWYSEFSAFCFVSLSNSLHLPLGSKCLLGAVVQASSLNLITPLVRYRCPHPPSRLGLSVLQKNHHQTIPYCLYWAHEWEALTTARRQFSEEVNIKFNSPNGQFPALEASPALLLWVSKASYSRSGFLDYCFFGMSSCRSRLCPGSKFCCCCLGFKSTTYMVITSLSLPLNDLFFQGPACLELVGKSRTSHDCCLQTSHPKPELCNLAEVCNGLCTQMLTHRNLSL